MNYYNNTNPSLIEPGAKYFLGESLKQCQHFKTRFKNNIFNISLLIGFILLIIIILIYKFKGKLTPEEKKQKNLEKQQYILSKIKNYQDSKIRSQQSLITGLPQWQSDYELLYENKNNNKYI
jgi:hypothetical protein